MATHIRMIDSLSEAHFMAVSQGKRDIATLLLRAIELEQDKYTHQGKEEKRHQSINLLAVAKEREATVDQRLQSKE